MSVKKKGNVMNKTCFCGISEHCGYQVEIDMKQHDKVIYEDGYNKAIDDCKTYIGLHRLYAERSIDDYVNYLQMASWLNNKIAEHLKR